MHLLITTHRRRPRLVSRTLAALIAALVCPTISAPAAHASDGPDLLYYNINNGAGAIGQVDQNNRHITLRGYPAGSFGTGWTHVI